MNFMADLSTTKSAETPPAEGVAIYPCDYRL